MAVLNPEHLLEQAERLVLPPPAGPPRQVDVRRAISASYYAVFHHLLRAAGDMYVGTTKRNTREYALVYRSISHGALRNLCNLAKQNMPLKYQPYLPRSGLGPNIQAFSSAFVELQEKRHRADYDPVGRMKTSDAKLAIATAHSAIAKFDRVSEARRKAFLTLLLFPPRPGAATI
jgi:hypothetical protein